MDHSIGKRVIEIARVGQAAVHQRRHSSRHSASVDEDMRAAAFIDNRPSSQAASRRKLGRRGNESQSVQNAEAGATMLFSWNIVRAN
jgi:hypothetical protein